MSGPRGTQISGLEVDEDVDFSRRELVMERVGYIFLAGLIAAVLLGLAGRGPLSDATATTDGLSVEYQRIGRNESPASIVIRLDAGTSDRPVEIAISRALLDALEVRAITPEPREMRGAGDSVVLSYGSSPDRVVLDVRYQRPGTVAGDIESLGRRVHIGAFVLP